MAICTHSSLHIFGVVEDEMRCGNNRRPQDDTKQLAALAGINAMTVGFFLLVSLSLLRKFAFVNISCKGVFASSSVILVQF